MPELRKSGHGKQKGAGWAPETYSRTTPPQLYGKPRADRAMVAMKWLLGAWSPPWELGVRAPSPALSAATTVVSVARRTVVAGDGSVVELVLDAAPGETLPTWTAGAHIRVHLPSSRVREYSLCGDPDGRGYRIAVRKVSDEGASGEVHSLALGATLRISRPINAFPLALPGHGSSAGAVHFIAAGIGITPILPMIMTAERWSVPWTLLYLGRSRHDLPFLDRLAAYGNRVTIHVDDESGVMTGEDLQDSLPPGAALYLCGPARFVDLAVARFGDSPECAELHFERFGGAAGSGGKAFTVSFRSGRAPVQVSEDEGMLDALVRDDASISYSCRQGFCGTCRLKILDGEVIHRDSTLTDLERARGYMLPCVSRAGGDDLVIDL